MSLELLILVGSVLLFLSLVLGKTGYRFGVPGLLLFLIIGFVAGADGFGLITIDSPTTTQYIGVVALNIILFSGGMDTRVSELRPVAIPGVVLATVGVLLTALITGIFVFLITNSLVDSITFTLLESVLLASVMSSTDSASMFAILRSKGLSLKEHIRPLLELESGSNDPMAYMLTVVLIQLFSSPELSGWHILFLFLKQLILGALCGVVLGKISVRIINRINLDNDALYSVLLLTIMFFLFGFTSFVGGNGYLAVYVGGLLLGNHRFVHKRSSLRFFDGLTWLSQIVLFLALGLMVKPTELLPVAGVGLLIGIFMIFISRPISVYLSLLPFRKLSLAAKRFIGFVGLRGAVPIIFATYPMISDIPQSKAMFNIVFFITLLSLLIQGTQVSNLAHRLKLSLPLAPKRKLKEFDVEFSDEMKSATCEIKITPEMLANGVRLMDLSLSDHALVAMVKRKQRYFIPRGNTELKPNDVILVITDSEESIKETYNQLLSNKNS